MVGCGRSRVEAPTHEIYGLFPSPVKVVKYCLDNLRPGEAIRGISGTLEIEGQGMCYGCSKVFYVVAPTCDS
jgi:hypothetical protein